MRRGSNNFVASMIADGDATVEEILRTTGLEQLDALALNQGAKAGWDDAAFEGRPPEVGADAEDHRYVPADSMIIVGSYRIKVAREKYDAWIDRVRKTVGMGRAEIQNEIRKRLGL